ncbi:MAG: hypothetical protein IPF77_16015 [Gemmatimonadetes bacterium]|nr:hypothetical protein [Gemmatimonadota bacterium]
MARVTTYAPDRYERDSLMTDALGSWRTRYEAVRGLVDALMTPLGDTLLLSFDHQGRLVADSIRSAGLRVTNALSYTSDGTPKRWSTAMQVPSTWGAGADDQGAQNDALPALQPVWNQIRGLGGAADTLRAELLYDARERLSTWDGIGSLSGGVTESYTIDRAGNLGTVGGGEVFHGTTNRMLRRANGASRAWNYSYDAAGNLIQAVDSGTVSVTYTYAYDALNRLVRVAQGATLIARYAYDVLGRRIAKRVYSAATGGTVGFTRFVYHGGQVAFETDSAGSTIGTRYVWGPGTDNLVAFRTTAAATEPLLCGDRQAGQRPPDHQAGRHLGQDLWLHALRERRCQCGVGGDAALPLDRPGVGCGDGLVLPPGAVLRPGPAALRAGGPGRGGGGENLACVRGGGRWWPRTRRGLGRTRSSRSGPAIVARRVMRDGMGGLG